MSCIKTHEAKKKTGCIWMIIALGLLSVMFVVLAGTVASEFMLLALPTGIACLGGIYAMLKVSREHRGAGKTAEELALEACRKQEPNRAWLGTDQYTNLKSLDTNRGG